MQDSNTLRTRKIKKGTQLSFYLDYYPGYRDESTMKVQRHESLGIYIFAKPRNQREKDYNERMTEKAEALRCRRYESIVNERYDFFDREKEKGNFLAWFKKKADSRNTKWQNVYKHFETFCEGKCTFGEIDVDLCNKFKEHLYTAPQTIHKKQKLHTNTIAHHPNGEGTPLTAGTRKACQHRLQGTSVEESIPLLLPHWTQKERRQGIDMEEDSAIR